MIILYSLNKGVIMSRKLSKRESEVLNHIIKHTSNTLKSKDFNSLGLNAYDMSLDINTDRANLSRTLNNLTRDGFLIKLLGRPTSFISRRTIEQFYPDVFFPEILDKKTDFKKLVNDSRTVIDPSTDPFSNLIGHNKNESLGEIVSQIKSSIDYPPHGLPIILYGEAFTGKRLLVQSAIDYSVKRKLLKNQKHVYWIDCLNLTNENELFNLINRFVRNDKDFKFLIIQDFDILTEVARQRLKSIIINQAIYDYESQNIHPLNANLFLVTQKDLEFIHKFHFEQIIPTIVKMPSFDDRNLKEKITFILSMFQTESRNINRNIKVTRNIINCFALSSFPGNLDHLKIEIKNAILNYFESPSNDKPTIELDFEHLSDQLLNRITNVNNQIQELENLYEVFNISHVILSPNADCVELRRLQQQELYSINNQIKVIKSNHVPDVQSLTQICKICIQEAENIKFDTLRSKTISELYDLITEDLESTGLTSNDHLYYGLLNHINHVVESLKSKNYHSIYQDDFPSSDIIMIDLAEKINQKLESHFKINIPRQEIRYIIVYLSLAKQLVDDCRISILVMCRLSRVSESYTKFIKALNNQIKCENFEYNFFDFALKKESFINALKEKIYELNSGKGVLIVSDELIPSDVEKTIHSISENCLLIPNITISKMEKIVSTCQNKHSLIGDFLPYIEEYTAINSDKDIENFDLLDLIENELLGKSLTFLNPHKISELSFEVLAKIIKDLDIAYSDILAIRFVSHTSYMCERVIRGDQLVHKKMNDFINQNGKYLHIIENHFSLINDAFGIIIPQSELIYLTELFLDFM